MKLDKKALLLYAVTDRTWIGEKSLPRQIEEALKAGITFLQLREKYMPRQQFLEEAMQIKKLAKSYQVPFVINDDVEIALKCEADGVHLGQKDMAVDRARSILGADKIIGISAQTVKQAEQAQSQGADYIGVGAVFNTSTKSDALEVSFDTLRKICDAVTIPVIAIGGINIDNVQKLKGSGIQGIAVVSAIFASKNITKATKDLLNKVKEILNEEVKEY